MTILKRAIGAVPLLAIVLLTSCGGGSSSGGMLNDLQSIQGTVVGEQKALDTTAFVAKAQAEQCAATRNRLFVIDQKMVFWDRADVTCYDMSYAQTLYGATPQQPLCTVSDSIAGPRTSCADDQSRALFDTILKNLDKADLGLGAGHKVEALAFMPKSGISLTFESVAADAFSGVKTAKNVVLKDAAAWHKLWAEHAGNRSPAPPLPAVDFSRQMLVGVFAGEHANGCRHLEIIRVGVSGARILVEYADQDMTTVALCAMAASSGMQVLAVKRSDAAVEFVNIPAAALAFKSIDQTTRSNLGGAQTLVIRDAAGWSALWAAHSGNTTPEPAVDFGRYMVLAVFLGSQPNGCYSTGFSNVYRADKTIYAVHIDTTPGIGVLCTMQITTPAHLIQVERSDDTVEFASLQEPIR